MSAADLTTYVMRSCDEKTVIGDTKPLYVTGNLLVPSRIAVTSRCELSWRKSGFFCSGYIAPRVPVGYLSRNTSNWLEMFFRTGEVTHHAGSE